MTEEKVDITDILREFAKTMEKGDIEKTLSFVTEDIVWATPNGTFKGKVELRRFLSSESMQEISVTETGNGIIAQGNKAFFEHILASTYQGRRAEWLAMCAYEFEGDKIQHVRTTFDRLLLAKQVTSGLPKLLVNQIIKQSEKLTR